MARDYKWDLIFEEHFPPTELQRIFGVHASGISCEHLAREKIAEHIVLSFAFLIWFEIACRKDKGVPRDAIATISEAACTMTRELASERGIIGLLEPTMAKIFLCNAESYQRISEDQLRIIVEVIYDFFYYMVTVKTSQSPCSVTHFPSISFKSEDVAGIKSVFHSDNFKPEPFHGPFK